MGDPVRIVDLAKDLIALSGLDPERDIEIKFTGVRPGEKLFEELLNPETKVLPTPHEKIMVVQAEPLNLDGLNEELTSLIEYAQIGDEKSLLAKLAALVPGYLNGHAPKLMPQEKLGRILLLGKDAYTRMTLRRILQPRYVIFEAESESEALHQVEACHPNLAILDFHLPEVNVRRLCAKLKRANGDARLPLIILANSSETTSLNQVLAMGADDWIYKPIPVSILENRVERLIKRTKGEEGGLGAGKLGG
jgi:CheY-like chemotaxis protein